MDEASRDKALSNLQSFLSDHCANFELRKLITGDPGTAEEVAVLNRRAWTAREEEVFRQVVGQLNLNGSQRLALHRTLEHHLSLIQGPPGTGKTSTSAATLQMHQRLSPAVAVAAPSNNAVDEVAVRLVRAGVPFLRVGLRSRIARQHLPTLEPHSLDFMIENEVFSAPGGKAWKRDRGLIHARELEGDACVGGTLEGIGVGPTLTTTPRVASPASRVQFVSGLVTQTGSSKCFCVPLVEEMS